MALLFPIIISFVLVAVCRSSEKKHRVSYHIQAIHLHSPPTITLHPGAEITFKAGEPVQIPCRATGEPPPSYTWLKNNQPLAISNIDIKQLASVGTIVINEPVGSSEGVYQCNATNNFGTAMSLKAVLKKAVQEPFPSVKDPKIHRPLVGSPLTLHCQPPASYPKGLVYWGEIQEGARLKSIENSARISLDYEGNLHFAHVLEEDARGGVNYVCIVQNLELRSLVQGDDQKINPQPITGTPRPEAPRLMWPLGNSNDVALKGQTMKIKCIFSGYPTPSVRWIREDALLPSKVVNDSFGQEIRIPDVDYPDTGTYKCIGRNSVSEASRTVTLRVESPPYWKNDKQPEDVNTSEEESARFDCQAMGQPKPDITWYINGIPLKDMLPEPRRTQGKDYLIYSKVTKSDAQVIQCNASNVHGYIFANAFLNVLAEPPTFTDTPLAVVKVAQGQNVTLTCRVFGAPKPTITWRKSSIKPLLERTNVSGDRFIQEHTGNLRILNVAIEDQGTYHCTAVNKFGDDEANGELLVRNRTFIAKAPETQSVNASSDVVFHCAATTDSEEKMKLKIDWLKNGQKIDYEHDGSKNVGDNSLRLNQVQVSDSGSYTCNASNGLDSDSVTVKLTVKDRPDPPHSVEFKSCTSNHATIQWSSGKDNNDPITQYIVYYNTSYDEVGKFQSTSPVQASRLTTTIQLLPWTNYTVHVRARNALGMSERSGFSVSQCSTAATRPYRNPDDVCTRSEAPPDQLVITWTPLSRSELNGEDFHYIVTYKSHSDPSAVEQKRNISDWQQGELVINDQETFQEYEIYVQAANKEGIAPLNHLVRKIGYSGQDTPLVQPQNFHINTSTLNGTYVEFLWEPVDRSPEKIRGFFKGYEIHFWRSNEPDNPRIEVVIVNTWIPCHNLSNQRFRRYTSETSENLVKGHTNLLWPHSHITAAVLVLNAGKKGQMSDTITFTTPESVPSVVQNFRVVERGSHHVRLAWNKPAEPNGRILRYEIEYRKAPPSIDQITVLKVTNPDQIHKKIHSLQNETNYIFYIYAVTSIGRGPVNYCEESTLPSSAPSQPVVELEVIGENSINVSWVPDLNNPPRNPGNMFYLEYRKTGSDDWEKTEPENEHNWINVTDLESGASYEFRVVAKNSGGDETKSDPKTIVVPRPGETRVKSSVASMGWFIGLMCAIAFLLLILLIICLIKRNRGGKYAVHEKEKLRGHDSTRDDEEAGFGEYTRTEDLNKSRGSLESEEKPLDSETDSLGEYEDPDPSKFNEDGSFIGQYGGKKKVNERLDHDVTTPSALSTFI